MTPFTHFVRLVPYAPTPNVYQAWQEPDLLRAAEAQPDMPVIAGDTLRFLVPYSALGKRPEQDVNRLAFYWVRHRTDPLAPEQFDPAPCGRLRLQDGANYAEIRLQVSAAPAPGEYRQFALCYEQGGQQRPILGTFRYQTPPEGVSLTAYIDAIRAHYVGYPYTPVTVDVRGNELLIRAFHSSRFRLGHVPLQIGLGQVLTANPNQPSLHWQPVGQVDLPAEDRYQVTVSEDIEAGNTFQLAGRSYQAAGTEAPADVLAALGVPDGLLTLPAGTDPRAGMLPGTYSQPNTNRPSLQLFYENTVGGTDYYRVEVGPSVAPGNLYQVSIDGQPTQARLAGTADTAASVAAVFAHSGGKLPCPAGKVPQAVVVAGNRLFANTNAAALSCRLLESLPARTRSRYVSVISSSIRRGNRFVLGDRQVTVPTDQTSPADVARLLDQADYPFTVDLAAGQTPPTAYAEPGPRYQAPEHLAAVELIAGSIWRPHGPLVAEVRVPRSTQPGRYHLHLAAGVDGQRLNSRYVSTFFQVLDSPLETVLLQYGPGEGPGLCMGYEYNEPGLMQQVRVPVALSTGKQRQKEAWSSTLDRIPFRTMASAERVRTLTTDAQPETFHRALLAALKHRQVWLLPPGEVRPIEYRQEGEYKQTDLGGRRNLQQGQAELVEVHSLVDDQPLGQAGGLRVGADADALAMGLVRVERVEVPGGIAVYLESTTSGMIRQIRPGSLVPPGGYRLRVRCGRDALLLTAFVNNIANLRTTLTAAKLNRTDELLTLNSEAVLSITSVSLANLYATQPPTEYPRVPINTTVTGSTKPASSPFSTEWGAQFT
ncbi:hypothetical protein [Spirosoma sordidisoli]|uniref:Uncharacterized protein n=1 Tax=Spirosoma sordidisoli TaxID=2502893 RepID=A0A4Q2UC30_9BACT|nr:hypothetical protein [Spirosoma sordidisoli]RYC66354.1 hypothetical protein EQG79_30235 [Spirosoma sordidisoli]